MRTGTVFLMPLFFAASYFCAVPVSAQSSLEMGTLKMHVEPKQAYVFLDGKASARAATRLNWPLAITRSVCTTTVICLR